LNVNDTDDVSMVTYQFSNIRVNKEQFSGIKGVAKYAVGLSSF